MDDSSGCFEACWDYSGAQRDTEDVCEKISQLLCTTSEHSFILFLYFLIFISAEEEEADGEQVQ